jgi:hypothetical protein
MHREKNAYAQLLRFVDRAWKIGAAFGALDNPLWNT